MGIPFSAPWDCLNHRCQGLGIGLKFPWCLYVQPPKALVRGFKEVLYSLGRVETLSFLKPGFVLRPADGKEPPAFLLPSNDLDI